MVWILLSFWRHPFTAEHPLLSDAMLHFSKSVLIDKLTHLHLEHFSANFHFWVNYSYRTIIVISIGNCVYTYIHKLYILFSEKYIPKLSKKCFENIECFFSICILCALAGSCARLKWLVSWPLAVLLYYTVPNCVLPRWHRWFMITFIASTLWIAIFSYLMVWDGKQRSK